MYIKDSFTERELELLETIGIYLHDGEYDDFEIAELDDIVVDAVMNNTDEAGNFTELAEEYNYIHEKMTRLRENMVFESDEIYIKEWFSSEQIALLEDNGIDLDRGYDLHELEHFEDLVYNIMMSLMDENGDYTEEAEKYERIIDVIVKIENEM